MWFALLVLALKWSNKYTWGMLAFVTFYLLMDTINIIHIKRAARHRPDVLDEKIN